MMPLSKEAPVTIFVAASLRSTSVSTITGTLPAPTPKEGFPEEYADFLECHVEDWTVTTDGSLLPGIRRHFIRIHPVDADDPDADEDPNHGLLAVRNRAPGTPWQFPAKEVVDGGFLELVRYGIRKPGDPLVEDSLQVVDALLKVHTPFGPAWRRYNHDGYGQQENGGPYRGWGKGRAWPLLTGERGHYELAAGRDPRPLIRAMEGFASATGLIPEQVWDEADRPEFFMYLGRPTGSAMPLMWAHAEYVKLLRSARDGGVYDRIPSVMARYQGAGRRVAGADPLHVLLDRCGTMGGQGLHGRRVAETCWTWPTESCGVSA